MPPSLEDCRAESGPGAAGVNPLVGPGGSAGCWSVLLPSQKLRVVDPEFHVLTAIGASLELSTQGRCHGEPHISNAISVSHLFPSSEKPSRGQVFYTEVMSTFLMAIDESSQVSLLGDRSLRARERSTARPVSPPARLNMCSASPPGAVWGVPSKGSTRRWPRTSTTWRRPSAAGLRGRARHQPLDPRAQRALPRWRPGCQRGHRSEPRWRQGYGWRRHLHG